MLNPPIGSSDRIETLEGRVQQHTIRARIRRATRIAMRRGNRQLRTFSANQDCHRCQLNPTRKKVQLLGWGVHAGLHLSPLPFSIVVNRVALFLNTTPGIGRTLYADGHITGDHVLKWSQVKPAGRRKLSRSLRRYDRHMLCAGYIGIHLNRRAHNHKARFIDFSCSKVRHCLQCHRSIDHTLVLPKSTVQ